MPRKFVSISLLLCVVGGPCGVNAANFSGGFSYRPVGSGQCRILFDDKYMQPVFEISKTAPPKVVFVGTKTECPTEFSGYKGTRIMDGKESGFIYTGVFDSGRRLHIYRKMGSRFTFRYGPSPKR